MFEWLKNIIRYWNYNKSFPQSKIYFGCFINKESSLGKNSVLFKNVVLQNSKIDDYAYIQSNTILNIVDIGKFCSIAANVQIGLANHPIDMVSTNPIFYDNTQPLPFFFIDSKVNSSIEKRTIIESDVWIGQGSMIKAGVKIGIGAIIGAGAVVTKDVEPYSIMVGVPAKHLKWRFNEKIRRDLLVSKWWLLEDKELKDLAPLFINPKLLLEHFKKDRNDSI